ncbi:MAG: DUF4340 domain-containing protein [Saprospiraceae bacterium]
MAAKKRNNTLWLLIGFLIVAVAAYFLIGEEEKETKTEALAKEMKFATPGNEVYKIFLAKRSGEETTLERKDDYWVYNGKYRANQNVVDNLLQTISHVTVKFIPSSSMQPNIIKELATLGIKVELYDASDNLIKAYYVGGMTNNELGTHMIMEGSDRPFVCYLETAQGGLRARFDMEGDEWRDKALYREKPEQIEKVTIEYPLQKSQSFVLERKGKEFEVSPLDPLSKSPTFKADETKVNSFLVGFDKVIAEAFENSNPKRDSILSLLPFATIQIIRKGGEEKLVQYFPIDKDLTDNVTGEKLPVERYYAQEKGGDFYLVQQRVVGKLFWGYSNFIQ